MCGKTRLWLCATIQLMARFDLRTLYSVMYERPMNLSYLDRLPATTRKRLAEAACPQAVHGEFTQCVLE